MASEWMPFLALIDCRIGQLGKNKYPQNSRIFGFSSRRSEFRKNDDFSGFDYTEIRC